MAHSFQANPDNNNKSFLPMIRCVVSIALLFNVFLAGCASTPKTPETTPLDRFGRVMMQERAWAGLETRQVEVHGLNVTYSIGGPEGAPTVVLLHGLAADRNHWNRVAKRLAKDFRLYIPDLPGHGQTAPLQDPSLTQVGEIVNGFIDSIPAQRVHVVGHSLGGAHAIRLSITRMSRIASLALVNSAGVYANNPSRLMRQMMEQEGNPFHIEDIADMERLFAQVSEIEPFIPDDLKAGWLQGHLNHQPAYQATLDAMRATSSHFTPEAFRANLRFIRAPVLLVWGEEDRLFPLETLQELQAALPDARTERLPGVGHMPLFEAPHMTALAIRDFVQGNN